MSPKNSFSGDIGSARQVSSPVQSGAVETSPLRNQKSKKAPLPRTGDSTLTTTGFPGPYQTINNPQARRMLNVYHFVYRDSGYHFRPTREDLIFFEWLGSTNRLPSYLKWKTANILARAVKSFDMVPCPFELDRIPSMFDYYFHPSSLGLGHENGFHRMKLSRSNDRYVRFCFSLYQSKAASLPLDDWEKSASVIDTVNRLGTEKNVETTIMLPAGLFSPDELEKEIVRTVDEVFPRHSEHPGPFRVPTQGAEFGHSRSNGGSLGCLLSQLGYTWTPYKHFDSMFEGPCRAVPVYTLIEAEDISLALIVSRTKARLTNLIPCHPVALTEPFKVRVITKGWGPSYEVARSYQPRIWRGLKEHPTFRLVGESINRTAMSYFASQLDPREEKWIISGDYKQATDHIPSYIARLLYERVCARTGIPFEDVPALLSSLTDHWIQDNYSTRCRVVQQASGQLMGSPSSFPILCLYNATLSRIAYEWAHEDRIHKNLDEIPMLVNGDDLLLGGDVSTYLTWKRVVRWGGLIPSVGKTLVSTKYGTINSTLFRFDNTLSHGVEWVRPTHIPHLQTQLAIGSIKKNRVDEHGRDINADNPVNESYMHHLFMDSARDKATAWRFLFGVNRDKLFERMSLYPRAALCLPVEAGGLGFPLPPRHSIFYRARAPRTFSLRIARMLLECPDRKMDLLRQKWLSFVQIGRKQSCLSAVHNKLRAEAKLPWLPLRLSEVPPTLLPPSRLCYSYSLGAVDYTRGRDAYLPLINAERKYDRAPWTQARVVDFLRTKKWTELYGRYSSGLEPCRSYPHSNSGVSFV